MQNYRTRAGDTIDSIGWRYYRRHDTVVEILNANPGLSDYPDVLPANIIIRLPDLPPADDTPVRLWQ